MYTSTVTAALKTGSRLNRAEAEAIVCWLELEKDNLEKTYKKPIQEIVAVVTPLKPKKPKYGIKYKKYQEMRNIKI